VCRERVQEGHLESAEPVPFRLTRNLQSFFTAYGIEGLFIASLGATAQALTAPHSPLEHHLTLFFRDELMTHQFRPQRPGPDGGAPPPRPALATMVQNNVQQVRNWPLTRTRDPSQIKEDGDGACTLCGRLFGSASLFVPASFRPGYVRGGLTRCMGACELRHTGAVEGEGAAARGAGAHGRRARTARGQRAGDGAGGGGVQPQEHLPHGAHVAPVVLSDQLREEARARPKEARNLSPSLVHARSGDAGGRRDEGDND